MPDNLYARFGNYTVVPNSVVELMPKIGSSAYCLYSYLRYRIGNNDNCYPKYDTISKDTGMSKPTISNAIKILVENKLLSVERRPDSSNIYTLEYPPNIGDDPSKESLLDPVKNLYLNKTQLTRQVRVQNSDLDDPAKYFADKDNGKEKSKPFKTDDPVKEYKERIGIALAKGIASHQGGDNVFEDYVKRKVPAHLKDLASAFINRFGRLPRKTEEGRWFADWNAQYEIGLNDKDIDMAFGKMLNDGLSIKAPGSVTSIAYSLKMAQYKQPVADGFRYKQEYDENGLAKPIEGLGESMKANLRAVNPDRFDEVFGKEG